MKFFDRALLAQVVVVVCRPLVFIWSVSQISQIAWGGWYLLALGLMPLFAVADVFFQAGARHSFIAADLPVRVSRVYLIFAWGVVVAAMAVVLGSASSPNVVVAVGALVGLYVVAAMFNRFEAFLASSNSVLRMAAAEISGYMACACIALTGRPLSAAIAATMVFPAARILTVLSSRVTNLNASNARLTSTSRSKFVGYAVASQVFASLAAGAPALVSMVIPGGASRIGAALITFKIVFEVYALLSTEINLLGVRVFYGVINFNVGPHVSMVRMCESILFLLVPVVLVVALVLFAPPASPISMFAIGLCAAFSYLNVLSSLAIMRGRPSVSASSQLGVCFGAFGLALLINDVSVVAGVFLLLFTIVFCMLTRRVRVSGLLSE